MSARPNFLPLSEQPTVPAHLWEPAPASRNRSARAARIVKQLVLALFAIPAVLFAAVVLLTIDWLAGPDPEPMPDSLKLHPAVPEPTSRMHELGWAACVPVASLGGVCVVAGLAMGWIK